MKPVFKWISLIVVLSLALASLAGCASSTATDTASSSMPTEAIKKGDLTAHIITTGSVRANRAQTLTWSLSGQVGTLNVKMLDTVNVSDVLAEMDRTSLPQSVILAQADLWQAQQALEDLQHVETKIAQAHLDLVTAQQDYDKILKRATTLSRITQTGSQTNIDIARADYAAAEDALKAAEEMFKMVENEPADSSSRIMFQAEVSRARQRRDQTLYNLNYLTNKPAQTDIDKAQAELEMAQAKLTAAERAYAKIKDGTSAGEIAAAQARVDATQATLNQTMLKAPFSGIITYMNVQAGDQVQAGSLAMQMEDRSRLYVDVNLSEIDVNDLKTGQKVALTFDAIPGKEYEGQVLQIGITGSRDQGSVTYPVVVEILKADDAIKTGMTATVRIQTREVKDVLLVPNKAVRVLNSQRVVFVKTAGMPLPQPVAVNLGVSSGSMSQVLSGLNEGDEVVTNPDNLMQMQMSVSGGE